jgi:signal transduction histidine kinase/ActR/RegA family two-component response regulator
MESPGSAQRNNAGYGHAVAIGVDGEQPPATPPDVPTPDRAPTPLRTYLARLFLGTTAPLVLLASILIYNVLSGERETVRQSMVDVARTLSGSLDAEVGRTMLALQVLAMSDAIDARDWDRFRGQASHIRTLHQRMSNIVINAPDGTSVLNLRVPKNAPIPPSNNDAFIKAAREGKSYVSNVFTSPTSGKTAVSVVVPVVRDGQTIYVLAATMESDLWTAWLKDQIPAQAIAAVDDRNGIIFARSERPEAFVGQPAAPAVRAAYVGATAGVTKAKNREGLEIYAAFHASATTGWHTIIVMPAEAVDAALQQYVVALAGGSLLVLVLAYLAAAMFARPLRSGTLQLRDSITAVGEGRRPGHVALPVAELDEAQRSAERAADLLASARNALQNRTDQVEALVAGAPMGVCLVDAELRLSAINPAAHRLFHDVAIVNGMSFAEALHSLWGDRADEVLKCVRHTLDTGEPSAIDEFSEGRADLTYEWRMERLPLPDGGHGVVCYFRDISAQVQTREDLVRQREELQTTLDVIPVGIAIAHDPEANQISVSPRFSQMLGLAAGINASLTGPGGDKLPFRCVRGGVPVALEELPMQVAARTGREVRAVEFDLELADGRVLHMMVNAAPLFDADGRVRGSIGAHVDISSLKEAQLALEAADRQKNEFLATLAHELRNPMAPIRFAAELLRRDASPATLEQARQTIDRQSAHLSRLLDDLLDLSRITRNVIELRREPVELRRVLQAAMENVRPLAEEQRHRLHLDIVGTALWVNGDPARLLQVVDNLLNNACKYTEPGGDINVSARVVDKQCEIRVSDTGVGLAPEMLPAMFRLFSQVHPAIASAKGGLGIGLAVVRRLVELHGGSITVESSGLHRGSTFIVRLPLLETVAAPHVERAPAADEAGTDLRRLSVLVVDDNIDAVTTLSAMLELVGVSVAQAYTAADAYSAAERLRPDVAILDIGLPDGSGNDVARRIRAQPWGKDMLLVAQTGWGQKEDRDRTAAAGFDTHLVKPVEPRQIIALLTGFAHRPARFDEAPASG